MNSAPHPVPLQWTNMEAKAVQEILEKHLKNHEKDVRVYAFGSRTLGHAKPFSDLDLVVEYAGKAKTWDTQELREAFSDSDLPYRVDVHDWALIPEEWRASILHHRRLIFSK